MSGAVSRLGCWGGGGRWGRTSGLHPVELFVGELVTEIEALVADPDAGLVQRLSDRGHSSDAAEPLAEATPQNSEQVLSECDAGPDPARRADRHRGRPLRREAARRQLSAEPAPGAGGWARRHPHTVPDARLGRQRSGVTDARLREWRRGPRIRRPTDDQLAALLERCRSDRLSYEPIGASLDPADGGARSAAETMDDGARRCERVRSGRRRAPHLGGATRLRTRGRGRRPDRGRDRRRARRATPGWLHRRDVPDRRGGRRAEPVRLRLRDPVGSPGTGEEAFVIVRDGDGGVRFDVEAVSTPRQVLARCSHPSPTACRTPPSVATSRPWCARSGDRPQLSAATGGRPCVGRSGRRTDRRSTRRPRLRSPLERSSVPATT